MREKALEILKYGDPIQYITDSCGRMVLGRKKRLKNYMLRLGSKYISVSWIASQAQW